MPIWHLTYYHIFLSISKNNEVDTQPLITILQGKDKNVVIPKISNERLVNYLLMDSTVITTNSWGLPEPQNGIVVPEDMLDVVFVPLLAMDRKGHRVGYGGGYYDRFLQRCRPNVIKIGLSFFDPIPKIDDVSPTDVALDFCVTPKEIYEF